MKGFSKIISFLFSFAFVGCAFGDKKELAKQASAVRLTVECSSQEKCYEKASKQCDGELSKALLEVSKTIKGMIVVYGCKLENKK